MIPVKLLFVAILFFTWKRLFKLARDTKQYTIARYFVFAGVISVILSAMSMQKIYPYGIVIDMMIFAFFASVVMALDAKKIHNKALIILLIIVPSLLPISYMLHYLVVGGAMNKDSFIAVFQTTSNEGLEYLASFTSVVSLVVTAIIFGLLFWVFFKHLNRQISPISGNTTLKLAMMSLLVLFVVPKEKGLFIYPIDTYQVYTKEIETVKGRNHEYASRKIEKGFTLSKEGNNEVYVVIVGESLNKHHMGVYGYPLDTTPELSKFKSNKELYVVEKSYSNYPGTMKALSQALTTANQKNKKNYTDSIGIVQVLNEANFNTRWIGNQPLSNSYDMMLGVIAKQADTVELTFDLKFHSMSHKDHKPDGVLLPIYQQALNEIDSSQGQNTAIFIHLMGNHTDYCERYPKEYEKYSLSLTEEIWHRIIKGGLGHTRECYDNSVLYNDFVVSEIIKGLKNKLGDTEVGGMLYFADHSEDIKRGVGHSTANFSVDMLESPTLIWLSEGYKQQYPNKAKALEENIDELYSNDFVYDSLIGLSGIKASEQVYCDSCDIFHSSYSLPQDEARTMHGEKAYEPITNYDIEL